MFKYFVHMLLPEESSFVTEMAKRNEYIVDKFAKGGISEYFKWVV